MTDINQADHIDFDEEYEDAEDEEYEKLMDKVRQMRAKRVVARGMRL